MKSGGVKMVQSPGTVMTVLLGGAAVAFLLPGIALSISSNRIVISIASVFGLVTTSLNTAVFTLFSFLAYVAEKKNDPTAPKLAPCLAMACFSLITVVVLARGLGRLSRSSRS